MRSAWMVPMASATRACSRTRSLGVRRSRTPSCTVGSAKRWRPGAAVGLDQAQPARFAEVVETSQRWAADHGREHLEIETASDDRRRAEEFSALGWEGGEAGHGRLLRTRPRDAPVDHTLRAGDHPATPRQA